MADSTPRAGRLLHTRSHPDLVQRLGLAAATKYDRAIRLYSTGGTGALLCSATFIITTSAGLNRVCGSRPSPQSL